MAQRRGKTSSAGGAFDVLASSAARSDAEDASASESSNLPSRSKKNASAVAPSKAAAKLSKKSKSEIKAAQLPPATSNTKLSTPDTASNSPLNKLTSSSKPKPEISEPSPEKKRAKSSPSTSARSAVDTPSSDHTGNQATKAHAIYVRVVATFAMIGLAIALILAGPVWLVCLILGCQMMVYREITALFGFKTSTSMRKENGRVRRDRWSTILNWYWFVVANYYLYGETIIYYLKHIVFADPNLIQLAKHHRFISFCLYTIGFVGFVANLKREHLKRQFGLFCWVHMSILLIVMSSHFIVNNLLEGVIWFFLPASLVICNDIGAYIFGMTMGRTPLIKLSPKKTVEGFVGGGFLTLVFAFFWATLFQRYNYMICPPRDLGTSVFSHIECTPNPVFVWRNWELMPPLTHLIKALTGHNLTSIAYTPFQGHAITLALFASIVAPFGGFFASGFKRAFGIKDFGHSIPGHGGLTDRMDCQFLMGMFAYVYYTSLIRDSRVSVGAVLQTIVTGLDRAEQLELFNDLKSYLTAQQILKV